MRQGISKGQRSEEPKQTAPLGRPKNQSKLRAILNTARTHFFEKGFDAVSIEGIAAGAGVSKMTVYSYFNDKETLFKAVVERESRELSSPLTQLPLGSINDLRNTLITFGMAFLEFITRPEVIQFNRLLISVAPRHPQLIHEFFQAGPATIYTKLADLLRQASATQTLSILNPERAADQLIAIWQGSLLMKFQLGLEPALPPEQLLDYVEDCVDTMLCAWKIHSTRKIQEGW
ncbi:putative transcriptional regulator [Calothrix sp. NIES-4071]|nr:putative transcriptional regulator [Calothrix sp. NIES-4071]BAZ59731.1 putative transcriptional regulator [Calothrix sp. NIES-4105]